MSSATEMSVSTRSIRGARSNAEPATAQVPPRCNEETLSGNTHEQEQAKMGALNDDGQPRLISQRESSI